MDDSADNVFSIAEDEVSAVLESLPAEVREVFQRVAICLEPTVPQDLIDEGISPDTLGLFSGSSVSHPDESDSPPTIHLFVLPIWHYSERRIRRFREEVRITLLHELGHFLDFEEDDLRQRNLD